MFFLQSYAKAKITQSIFLSMMDAIIHQEDIQRADFPGERIVKKAAEKTAECIEAMQKQGLFPAD